VTQKLLLPSADDSVVGSNLRFCGSAVKQSENGYRATHDARQLCATAVNAAFAVAGYIIERQIMDGFGLFQSISHGYSNRLHELIL